MSQPQPSPILEARRLALVSGVRTDSRMYALPEAAFEMLASLIFSDRAAPKAALAMMEAEGISRDQLPGLSALYQWQRDFAPFYYLASRRSARAVANETIAELRRNPSEWAEAIADQIGQETFEMNLNPGTDPEVKEKFVKLVIAFAKEKAEREKGERDERKLKLLEDAASQAKEQLTKVMAKGGLTPETQAQIQQALSLL